MPAQVIPSRALTIFFAIAFGLAWGLFALFAVMPETIDAVFGPPSATNPIFILAVYAPAIAALVVVLGYGGRAALGRFLKRLLLWRLPWVWIAFILVVIPALPFAGAALKGGPVGFAGLDNGIGPLLGALAFMLVLGPIEEFGWRGVALPLLQRHMAPVWAGLLLGLIWGVWHLPAFFAPGTPQSDWGFVTFLVGAVSVSVILTAMFNAAHGSLLWAALFHFQLNNPLWPDGQPWDMLAYVVVAAVVVALNRRTMFDRRESVTRVA